MYMCFPFPLACCSARIVLLLQLRLDRLQFERDDLRRRLLHINADMEMIRGQLQAAVHANERHTTLYRKEVCV